MRPGPKRRSAAERIAALSAVSESGCLLWRGHKGNTGYGLISLREPGGQRTRLVHRVAWENANGPIPEGMYVLHRCDTKLCCNPAHLFLGTHVDNMADMAAKGRAQRVRKKLTDRDVELIRFAAETLPVSKRAIARAFGISQGYCLRLLAG